MNFRRIITVLIILILYPQNADAGGAITGRVVRPADTVLRNRLATAHIVRGEPMEVIAISPAREDAEATDHYNLGIALSELGKFTHALEAYQRAIKGSEAGSETRLKAIEQFLRISDYNPDIDLPPLGKGEVKTFDPELSLHLSGYLAERGESDEAFKILDGATFRDPDRKVVAAILAAGHLAARDEWNASTKLIGRVKSRESSPFEDLLYLTQGYHHLQREQTQRARNSFSAISPSSPYSPEALLGKAWAFFGNGDLHGATITLEELVDRHPYSHAAREGMLDLALSYRNLGLHDKAVKVLEQHRTRLAEVRNWLLGLQNKDLLTGSDHINLLENALDGTAPDRERIQQTPYFVRQWIMDISGDPAVRQTTTLMKGLSKASEKAVKLRKRFEKDRKLVRREIQWVRQDISLIQGTMARLEELRKRLESIKDGMSRTLQDRSLDGFASERARKLISRTGELKVRLTLMENSVRKAEGFSSLVEQLSGSVTASEEESQLNRIRKQAYEGIISSRVTLRKLRNTLTALEGRLWLEVKGGAIQLERRTSLRVTSGRTRAGQALADSSKALGMMTSRQQELEDLERLLLKRKGELETILPGKLVALKNKIDRGRASRLLELAAMAAQEIREIEARILYTSADIEISRMQGTVRSLQEAVQ